MNMIQVQYMIYILHQLKAGFQVSQEAMRNIKPKDPVIRDRVIFINRDKKFMVNGTYTISKLNETFQYLDKIKNIMFSCIK